MRKLTTDAIVLNLIRETAQLKAENDALIAALHTNEVISESEIERNYERVKVDEYAAKLMGVTKEEYLKQLKDVKGQGS